MSSRLAEKHPVRGLLRWAMRLPIWLYRARLGWLLGHRFLMLTHTGRKSGLPRQTVLEVVRYHRARSVCIVASGWGQTPDWFLNVQKTPDVVVQINRRRFLATAAWLPPEDAERELLEYSQRYPLAYGELSRLIMGERLKPTAENCRRLAQVIPLVAFRPRVASLGHAQSAWTQRPSVSVET